MRREGRLLFLHHRQRRAQPFVFDDRAGFHGLDLVEDLERQRRPLELNREPAVRVVHDVDLLTHQPAREAVTIWVVRLRIR